MLFLAFVQSDEALGRNCEARTCALLVASSAAPKRKPPQGRQPLLGLVKPWTAVASEEKETGASQIKCRGFYSGPWASGRSLCWLLCSRLWRVSTDASRPSHVARCLCQRKVSLEAINLV
jgi:hypothetical protein